MPIVNQAAQAYREDWANTVTQLVGATRYGPFYPGSYTRALIRIDRTVDVGTETMDAKLQTTDPTGDFVDLLDHAGAAVSFVQWANDSWIPKSVEIGRGVLSSDADDTITFGTNFKAYNVSLPAEFYILITGAGGTSDTFSGSIDWLP